jgi:ribonuclease HI
VSGIKCFTGGSRTSDGNVGTGFQARLNGTVFAEGAFRMDPTSSSFQAELTAIIKATEVLLSVPIDGPVIIYTNSSAALHALNNPSITSKTVLATVTAMDELAFSTKHLVELQPARGSLGLLAAKQLAQHGAALPPTVPGPVVPVSITQLHNQIDAAVEHQWQVRWDGLNPKAPRQSHDFWPDISRSRSSELLSAGRSEYTTVVRTITGHNNMNYHRFKTQEVDTEVCRLCLDGDEASDHFFTTCPALEEDRLRVLGLRRTKGSDLGRLPLHGVRSFTHVIRRALSLVGLEKI